ncbi:NAD(P)-dependent oxidoreductase [Streptomyces sp. NPDC006984]|uniref:NAD-dependent epimerase/dehydratase family protein n=1 Tax=Streptomyces sp. NPDC006984 TaxID=3155463 RepID=UPI0033D42C16
MSRPASVAPVPERPSTARAAPYGPPATRRILVTGSTGFIGGRVVAACGLPGVRLVVARRSGGPAEKDPTVRYVHADLTDAASLYGVCDGIDIVLHCAARVGGPGQSARAVNEEGTRALLAEAERAGVRRFVQVGTASVYGRGVFRNAGPEHLPVVPHSPTSRTRAAAERLVLAAGGTVLRPHLVIGAGDRWVVPGLVRLHQRLAASVDGWQARMSVVDVDDLARAVIAVATPRTPPASGAPTTPNRSAAPASSTRWYACSDCPRAPATSKPLGPVADSPSTRSCCTTSPC